MLFGGYQENSWIIRTALETCDSYECAYDHLAHTPMPSYGYQILAGTKPGQGVVIARDRTGPVHEDHLNDTRWFVVQTNNDQWDTGCHNRCAAATERMMNIGQENISQSTIRAQLMQLFPTLNGDTLYNTEFTPAMTFIDTEVLDYTPTEEEIAADIYGYDKPPTFKDTFRELEEKFSWFELAFGLMGI